MKKRLYAVRDRIANDLMGVQMYIYFSFKTDQQAVRYFADAVNDEKSVLAKHPHDYELIIAAEHHDDGTIIPLEKPEIIITGERLLAAQNTPENS